MSQECTDTGQIDSHNSSPAVPVDLPLSATRTTHHPSQKKGPVSWSPDLRLYIHSSTGEFNVDVRIFFLINQVSQIRSMHVTAHEGWSEVSWKVPLTRFILIEAVIIIVSWIPRLETRMTADINVILQLLQRQMAPVPPAYSTVSSSTLPNNSPGLYGTGTPVLHSMYPISPIQMDSRAPTQV